MRASWYAKALIDLSSTLPEDELVTRLVGTLKNNNHLHMLPQVVRAYERLLLRKDRHSTITVTTERPYEQSEVSALLRKDDFARALTVTHKRVVRVVDPTIVGGAIVRTSSLRVDRSYKRALLDLYRSLITA
jgi:F0F1-type ATP synthase delta subunit